MRLLLLLAAAAAVARGDWAPSNNRNGGGGASKNKAKSKDFDFYLFVRQWDPAICDTMRCSVSPKLQNFTIHGLWPNRLDGSWPQYCNDTARFAPKAVAGLKPRLAAAWPAFGDGGDVGFWRHEWLRHGTCAAGALAVNETAYFEAALDLNDRLPLLAPLEAAGIHPSNTVARPHSVVVAALNAGLGVTPAVHCGAGAGGSKVTEVWVCIDKDGATPIDCPPAIKGKKGPGGAKGGQGKCANVTLPTLAGAAGAGSKGGGGGNGKAAGGAPATPAPALVKGGGGQDGWGGLEVDDKVVAGR